MEHRVVEGCEIAYGPGDNPYLHWARCLAPASAAAPPARRPACDGRRLRRAPCEGEMRAVPLVLRLDGKPGSKERAAARRALRERVRAGELRMDAHERDALAQRLREARRAPGGEPRREAYCVHHPQGARALDAGHVVVEQGAPIAVRRAAPAAPRARAVPPRSASGTAPVMGVIDDGLAFLNARFRRAGGRSTRFEALWMQGYRAFPGFEGCGGWPFGGPARPGFGTPGATWAGAILERGDIDHLLARGEALDEAAIYRRLSRAVHDDPDTHHALDRLAAHGTHVADLAAGADPHAPGAPGVRGWPILGVQLPPEAVSDTAGQHLQFLAIAGVRWILHRARRLGGGPVVITISFGALAGPKDGSRPIEWAIREALAEFEAREGRPARVNWSFGNARLNKQVARPQADEASGHASQAVEWRLQPDDRAASFLEIRPDEAERVDALSLEITPPGHAPCVLRVRDPSRPVTLRIDGRPALRLYRAPVPTGARAAGATAHLVLAAAPTVAALGGEPRAPHGAWRIALRWEGTPGGVRLEVQRGDTPAGQPSYGRQSYLDHPHADGDEEEGAAHARPSRGPITRAGTHTANADADPEGRRVWTTGAARPGRSEGAPRPTRYASAGRLGAPVEGPTISALAERGTALGGVLAAGALSGSVRASGGSSAAAPCASRALALLLAEARAPAAEPDRAREAREVARRWGAPADPAREDLPPTDPDHLKGANGPEPGFAARLGAGTVLGGAGRGAASLGGLGRLWE